MTRQPGIQELMAGTGKRQAYITGLEVLGRDDDGAVMVALSGLKSANVASNLEPPLTSVVARQIDDTLDFYIKSRLEAVDMNAARLLLAKAIDNGMSRGSNG